MGGEGRGGVGLRGEVVWGSEGRGGAGEWVERWWGSEGRGGGGRGDVRSSCVVCSTVCTQLLLKFPSSPSNKPLHHYYC